MKLHKAKQNSLRFLGNIFLATLINVLCKSLRIEKVNEKTIEQLRKENKNFVIAFWHGTMLLGWYLHGSKNVVALTSKSKDGDLLAKILNRWKYNVVRGSSSKGGDVALGVMVDYARNNRSIAITPDGPRGPVFKFKAGGVITAKKGDIPIVLAGVGFGKKKKLKGWDKFQVPYFFSKAKIVYSDPIYVDKNSSYEQTSLTIKKCEEELCMLQKEAEIF